MKARDYLATKGLAIAGARGRFSREALAELRRATAEGMHFIDYVVDSTTAGPAKKIIAPLITKERQRKETVFFGIDRGTQASHSAVLIAFETCYGCMRPVGYCKHTVPQLPAWLGGGDGMWTKPC